MKKETARVALRPLAREVGSVSTRLWKRKSCGGIAARIRTIGGGVAGGGACGACGESGKALFMSLVPSGTTTIGMPAVGMPEAPATR